jgi:hypothetical protein
MTKYDRDEFDREYVVRYVITHLDKHGDRVLADAQQGRNTYATAQEAEKAIEQRMRNNSLDTLKSVYGLPLEVRSCRCYPVHFDPMQRYFAHI